MFLIDWIKSLLGIDQGTDSLVFSSVVIDGSIAVKGELEAMAILNDIQQIVLAVEGRSKRGKVSQVYGVPTWESSTPEILTLEPAADGLSCTVKAAGELGDGNVKVTAQVRAGDPAETRFVEITIPVAASETETLTIVEGAISVQPEFQP